MQNKNWKREICDFCVYLVAWKKDLFQHFCMKSLKM